MIKPHLKSTKMKLAYDCLEKLRNKDWLCVLILLIANSLLQLRKNSRHIWIGMLQNVRGLVNILDAIGDFQGNQILKNILKWCTKIMKKFSTTMIPVARNIKISIVLHVKRKDIDWKKVVELVKNLKFLIFQSIVETKKSLNCLQCRKSGELLKVTNLKPLKIKSLKIIKTIKSKKKSNQMILILKMTKLYLNLKNYKNQI